MVFYKNFLTTLGADSIALVALAAIVYNFDCHRYHLPHSTRLLFCPLRSDGKTFWACSRLWILREEACYALLVCLPFSLNGHVVNHPMNKFRGLPLAHPHREGRDDRLVDESL